MNHTLSNPRGKDKVFKQFQEELYDALSEIYDFDIVGYPRIYKNQKSGSFIPEWFNGEDYEELYLDDSVPYTFFFLESDDSFTDDSDFLTNEISVCFAVNLESFSFSTREDARAENDAFWAIDRCVNVDFEKTGIRRTIPNVFRGYDTNQIQYNDMQPWHVFSVVGKLGYYLTKEI